ncbi:hypothetical protein EVAR_55722_1 [Eumeta japonica]|uniref:Uncharacterized protein n=1 Tax=Eumeta variegata TaxID=151549 RepID=A0A4C1YY48_EUMVA|nr:hypothetical protein EVAR_55722_1 [Eumeta japonica]
MWYLSHFALVHPAKLMKVRVVFDTAVRSGRTSLNDYLLPEFPEAVEWIVAHHYVEDFLQSFENTEKATRIATKVRNIHSKDNIHLRNACQIVKKSSRPYTQEVKINDGDLGEKVPGLTRQLSDDTLSFNLNLSRVPEEIIDGCRVATKREALIAVTSLFDLLRLPLPFRLNNYFKKPGASV